MGKAYLFYDGDCPFCNHYAQWKQLKRCIDLELVDARKNDSWKQYDENVCLDDGVILVLPEKAKVLQGVEAIAYLDNVCVFQGFMSKIQRFVFSHPLLARTTYGALKILRKLALFVKREF